jgi:hypothetical protein
MSLIGLAGDSNMIRVSRGFAGSLTTDAAGHTTMVAGAGGAWIRWSGCVFGLGCADPTATDFWERRLGTLPTPAAWICGLGVNDCPIAGTAQGRGYAWYGTKIDYMMGLFGPVPVFWTNLPVGLLRADYQPGATTINQSLYNAQPRWPNLRFVQWRSVAEPHPEYIDPDGIHLSDAGQAAYVNLVVAELATVL